MVPISVQIESNKKIDLKILNYFNQSRVVKSHGTWPHDLQKKGLGKLNTKKVQTGMQSVTYSFRNITALGIIDIINQLLCGTTFFCI